MKIFMPFLATHRSGRTLLSIHVQPRASRNAFTGVYDKAIKLAITAPPVDGKANAAVLKFLATFLHVKKKNLEISRGLQSRNKSILIAGLNMEDVRNKIEAVLL